MNILVKIIYFTASIFFSSIISVAVGFACNPNENCHRCLLHRPWDGGCIQHGNDPICEARKATCGNLGGAVTGAIFTGPLRSGGIIPGDTIQKCKSRPQDCLKEVIARGGYAFVRPIVDEYIRDLRMQAQNRFQRIPPHIQQKLARHFRFDLNAVRIAFGINTRHGQHITVGDEIFFVSQINFNSCTGFQLLAHELEHVDQYRRRGGIEPFMVEYILKAIGAVLERRSFNVHDFIDLEQAGLSKGRSVGCPQSATWQPGQAGPFFNPTPAPIANTCGTSVGRCPMTVMLPHGAPCFCVFPGAGMYQGRVP